MTSPLNGKTVLITRSAEQSKPFSDLIISYGGKPVEVPLLAFELAEDEHNKREFVSALHRCRWIFFTSAKGVQFFFKTLRYYSIDREIIRNKRFAVIGRKTNSALKQYGFHTNLYPDVYSAEQLGKQFLKERRHGSVLLIRGNLSLNTLPNVLQQHEIPYTAITVYRTVINRKAKSQLQQVLQREDSIDVITFTSPSAIGAFQTLGERYVTNKWKQKVCLVIGPTTEKKAYQQGFSTVLTPKEYTIEGMVKKILKHFDKKDDLYGL
ncbi:uroporphyrinogen-III synthase [Salirhabdus salicampi]|uniref:uroporphyrinogen-III synthase n=1 Tax=Salirhabdus salicampi TaxID=476102 RepID=UPI0020C361CB|nr:uroporphyrinogen-III synthase [Salirhabdus salicampi]MCP8617025.1 uroporphyrinogen-III synthase [Salirhabdus salicampi]